MVRGKNRRCRPRNIGWLDNGINSSDDWTSGWNKCRNDSWTSCRKDGNFWREIKIIFVEQIGKIEFILIIDVVKIIVVVTIEVKKSGFETSSAGSSGQTFLGQGHEKVVDLFVGQRVGVDAAEVAEQRLRRRLRRRL